MPLVFDASVVLAWLLPDERSGEASALIRRGARERMRAPSLLLLEVTNALRVAERRARLRPASRRELLADFLSLPILLEPISGASTLSADELAERHSLSVYDACYLELAISAGMPLATFDAALVRAAAVEGVALAAP